MERFDFWIMLLLTSIGAVSIGLAFFQITRARGITAAAVGNLIVGVGFALMGWDFLQAPSPQILTAVGAVVAMLGGSLIPLSKKSQST